MTAKTQREKLLTFDREQIDLRKLLVLTDSANAYASLVSGHPAPNEKKLRVLLRYVRNILNLLAISFLDKDYNLADAGAKGNLGNRRLLGIAAETNISKIGFIGRQAVKKLRDDRKRAEKVAPV